MTDIIKVIATMAEAVQVPSKGTLAKPQRPVITISRDYGSGGDIIAQHLAERLDIPFYDEELLEKIADRLKVDPATARMLDEGIGKGADMWLVRLLSGKDLTPDAYRNTLVQVVLGLGHMGGVIMGRGAHVILSTACALRVRISGTPEVCARRLCMSGGDEKAVLQQVKDINHARGKFVWEMFNSRLSDASAFDVTVNTDRMVDFDDVVHMLSAFAEAVHRGTVLGEAAGRMPEAKQT